MTRVKVGEGTVKKTGNGTTITFKESSIWLKANVTYTITVQGNKAEIWKLAKPNEEKASA